MKLNHTILFFISFYAANILHASSLSGKVTDKTNQQPIPYVTIYIPDLHVFKTTDSIGNYHFEKLPSATYQVQINALGFKTFFKVITISGATIGNFELDESTTELAEV